MAIKVQTITVDSLDDGTTKLSPELSPVVLESIREIVINGDTTYEIGGPIDAKPPTFDSSNFYRGDDYKYAPWDGTIEEFLEWTKTPMGALNLYEARKTSRIIVMTMTDRCAFEIWP